MIRNIMQHIYRVTIKPLIAPTANIINNNKINSTIDELLKYKNKHFNERCFIIGNGPSLTANDLNKLKREVCFASNRVYEIFDRTDWRPTYYCIQDRKAIRRIKEDIYKKIQSTKFVGIVKSHLYPNIKEVNFINLVSEDFFPNMPKFSCDVSKCIYEGSTVTYMCIQLAIYMGFKMIYLLGVDHNYSVTRNPDGTISKQDVQDHFSSKDKITNIPKLYNSALAYQAAKKYADEHGIKIYNATRGGKLEVFERVDFDSLF